MLMKKKKKSMSFVFFQHVAFIKGLVLVLFPFPLSKLPVVSSYFPPPSKSFFLVHHLQLFIRIIFFYSPEAFIFLKICETQLVFHP